MTEQLKKIILSVLPDVEFVIGWGPGPDPIHGQPLFMRTPEDVDKFMAGPLAIQNPALFLPDLRGKKVGIVVKGCDCKSIIQLISEKLIDRKDLVIIGFPCHGIADLGKIGAKLADQGELGEITAVETKDREVSVTLGGKTTTLSLDDVQSFKCGVCATPNAIMYDHFAGIARDPGEVKDDFEDLKALEAMSLDERLAFWEKEMSRCIRCYACRNACPMCVCRGECVASSREPHWITQADSTRDKLMFQVIHAVHLSGRCTGCAECQRACPVGIPVFLLKRTLGRAVGKLFGYKAGLDPEGVVPLLTFQVEEENIKEREW